jgi:hypothetical protein
LRTLDEGGLPVPRHFRLDTPDSRTVLVQIEAGRGGQMACRRCSNRPRASHEGLVELAKKTLAEGRCDVYM